MEENGVHLIELTVPQEDSIKTAHQQKENRYQALVEYCDEAGWTATHFLIEVGCRDFIASSMTKWMKLAGLSPKKEKALMKAQQKQ